mmetsp:Transcript_28565/g.51740  ORF Transcript_28565/g.51740 Transcript_28565/m.51740 type:complete len:215 (+) Transcript_28565:286-930(+)
MWQIERVNQLSDHNFGLLSSGFQSIDHLVDLGSLEPRLCQSPRLGSLLHRVGEHFLQVGVHRALMNTHDLSEHLVLPFTQPFFGLTTTTFLCLTVLTVALCQLHHGSNAAFLLEAQQLLGKLVEGLRNDTALHRLQHTFESLVAQLVDVPLLLVGCGRLCKALCCTQLVDEVQTLFLALEHLVLERTAADNALHQENCRLLLFLFGQYIVLVPW